MKLVNFMPMESATRTFVLPEPLPRALRSLRSALQGEELAIAAEMDLSGKLRGEFWVSLTPCCVLYVNCPLLLLQACVIDSSAPLYFPTPVVLSQRETQTIIHLQSPGASVPAEIRTRLGKLFTRIETALDRAGARPLVPQLVA
jgi:hypothetical protein